APYGSSRPLQVGQVRDVYGADEGHRTSLRSQTVVRVGLRPANQRGDRMTSDLTATRTAYRTCPLCEAVCGLELKVVGERVVSARGDREHVFSAGFVCPKGATFADVVNDPDRLRRPLLRRADGQHAQVSWDEAYAAVEAGLRPMLGSNAVALYLGNPN